MDYSACYGQESILRETFSLGARQHILERLSSFDYYRQELRSRRYAVRLGALTQGFVDRKGGVRNVFRRPWLASKHLHWHIPNSAGRTEARSFGGAHNNPTNEKDKILVWGDREGGTRVCPVRHPLGLSGPIVGGGKTHSWPITNSKQVKIVDMRVHSREEIWLAWKTRDAPSGTIWLLCVRMVSMLTCAIVRHSTRSFRVMLRNKRQNCELLCFAGSASNLVLRLRVPCKIGPRHEWGTESGHCESTKYLKHRVWIDLPINAACVSLPNANGFRLLREI